MCTPFATRLPRATRTAAKLLHAPFAFALPVAMGYGTPFLQTPPEMEGICEWIDQLTALSSSGTIVARAGHCGPCGNKANWKTENSACPDGWTSIYKPPFPSPPVPSSPPHPFPPASLPLRLLLPPSYRLLPPSPFRIPRGDFAHRFLFLYDFVYAHSYTRTRSTTSFSPIRRPTPRASLTSLTISTISIHRSVD